MVDLLRKQEGEDILVVAGGVIPKDDIPYLKEAGIAEVFTPGAPIKDIIEFLQCRFAQN
mgnify:FL=1